MRERLKHQAFKNRFGNFVLIVFCAATVLISLVPSSLRPETGLPSGNIEHLVWYGLFGFLMAGLRRPMSNAWWLAGFIVAFAGLMEFGQVLVPSRSASFEDFMISAVGGVLGVLIVIGSARVLLRRT